MKDPQEKGTEEEEEQKQAMTYTQPPPPPPTTTATTSAAETVGRIREASDWVGLEHTDTQTGPKDHWSCFSTLQTWMGGTNNRKKKAVSMSGYLGRRAPSWEGGLDTQHQVKDSSHSGKTN